MPQSTITPMPVAKKTPVTAARVSRVSTAFTELDEAHRVILCLRYVERLTLAQIAVVLDDTEENVRREYAEAVSRLAGRKRTTRRRKAAA